MTSLAMKRIVCLANSRKLSGRCVAGKEALDDGRFGAWVRPVSARGNEEVSEDERQYADGSDPRVLDVIDVPVLNAQPKTYQQENWLLDQDRCWQRDQRVEPNQLTQLLDPVAPLWTNGHSTANGRNDRVPTGVANFVDNSLRLIRVDSLVLSVSAPGEYFGNSSRRVQGRFTYGGADYWLWVTDPIYEHQYRRRPYGDYTIEEDFITVSLGEELGGYHYKLIAAVIEP